MGDWAVVLGRGWRLQYTALGRNTYPNEAKVGSQICSPLTFPSRLPPRANSSLPPFVGSLCFCLVDPDIAPPILNFYSILFSPMLPSRLHITGPIISMYNLFWACQNSHFFWHCCPGSRLQVAQKFLRACPSDQIHRLYSTVYYCLRISGLFAQWRLQNLFNESINSGKWDGHLWLAELAFSLHFPNPVSILTSFKLKTQPLKHGIKKSNSVPSYSIYSKCLKL